MNAETKITAETRTDILIFTDHVNPPEAISAANSKQAMKEAATHLFDLGIDAWEYALCIDHSGAARDVSDVTAELAALCDRVAEEDDEGARDMKQDQRINRALFELRH